MDPAEIFEIRNAAQCREFGNIDIPYRSAVFESHGSTLFGISYRFTSATTTKTGSRIKFVLNAFRHLI